MSGLPSPVEVRALSPFHLGCLRALHDLDLLNRVQVTSSVSGGAVISAMYTYSSDPFQVFDRARCRALTSWTLPRHPSRDVQSGLDLKSTDIPRKHIVHASYSA